MLCRFYEKKCLYIISVALSLCQQSCPLWLRAQNSKMATTVSTLLVILLVIPAILSFHPAERARIRAPRFTTLLNSGTAALYDHAKLAQDHVAGAHKSVQDQAYGVAGQHMATAQDALKQTGTTGSSATSTAQGVPYKGNDQVQNAPGTVTSAKNPHLDYVKGAPSDVISKPGGAVNDAGTTASDVYANTQDYVTTAHEDVKANPVPGAYKTVGTHADAVTGSAVPTVLPGE